MLTTMMIAAGESAIEFYSIEFSTLGLRFNVFSAWLLHRIHNMKHRTRYRLMLRKLNGNLSLGILLSQIKFWSTFNIEIPGTLKRFARSRVTSSCILFDIRDTATGAFLRAALCVGLEDFVGV